MCEGLRVVSDTDIKKENKGLSKAKRKGKKKTKQAARRKAWELGKQRRIPDQDTGLADDPRSRKTDWGKKGPPPALRTPSPAVKPALVRRRTAEIQDAAQGYAGLLKDLHAELRTRKEAEEKLKGQVKKLSDDYKALKDEALLQTAYSATQDVELCDLQDSLDAERARRIHYEDNYNFLHDHQEGFVQATTLTLKTAAAKAAQTCEEILDNATALLDQTRIGLTKEIKDVTQQQLDFLNNRKRSTSPTFDEQPGGDLKRLDQA